MEKIYAAEGARAIGVSDFLQDHLDTLLAETTVVPALNQIELHPTFQQAALSAASREHGIAIEGYSPLGQGADLDEATVTELAQKHGATPAQIVLAWHLGVGNIVIPKTTRPQRMSETSPQPRSRSAGMSWTPSPRWMQAPGSVPTPAEASFTQM